MHIFRLRHSLSLRVLASTRVTISQAITGLFAQQPCNNTVNMIEQEVVK